jgi:hypothetical protein
MAGQIEKLTSLEVSKKSKPGYYGDAAGLYLQVSSGGAKSWLFRFTIAGKKRWMGLGPFHTVSLPPHSTHRPRRQRAYHGPCSTDRIQIQQ